MIIAPTTKQNRLELASNDRDSLAVFTLRFSCFIQRGTELSHAAS